MPRSLGSRLPSQLTALFDGTDLVARQGQTFLLLSTDDAGWPHLAMLSVGELLLESDHVLRAALWLGSTSTRNLERDGRALLALVAQGAGYYVRLQATRGHDLDLGESGRLAFFRLHVEDVLEDAVAYARLTSGITFELPHPEQVLPRWQHTLKALRHAG